MTAINKFLSEKEKLILRVIKVTYTSETGETKLFLSRLGRELCRPVLPLVKNYEQNKSYIDMMNKKTDDLLKRRNSQCNYTYTLRENKGGLPNPQKMFCCWVKRRILDGFYRHFYRFLKLSTHLDTFPFLQNFFEGSANLLPFRSEYSLSVHKYHYAHWFRIF